MSASPTEGAAAWATVHARLREQFLTGLVARWAEIRTSPTPEQPLHRLAGAAGSFGFAAMSEAARAAERACETGQSAALELALIELESCIRHAGVTV